jgi:hypothetical protein
MSVISVKSRPGAGAAFLETLIAVDWVVVVYGYPLPVLDSEVWLDAVVRVMVEVVIDKGA